MAPSRPDISRPNGRSRGLAVPLAALLVATALLTPSTSRAAGPRTQMAQGETDLELYLGVDGLNPVQTDPSVFAGFTVAYGLANRLSAYLGNATGGDILGMRSNRALRAGLVTNVLEGPASLDLRLELRMDRPGVVSAPRPVPGLDLDLQLGSTAIPWGVYFRANLPLPGDLRSDADVVEGLPLFEFTPGLYVDLGDDGELYLEQDLLLQLPRQRSANLLANLGLALGYTFSLTDDVDFASEVAAIPDPLEPQGLGFGAMVGFIVTLPNSGNDLRR